MAILRTILTRFDFETDLGKLDSIVQAIDNAVEGSMSGLRDVLGAVAKSSNQVAKQFNFVTNETKGTTAATVAMGNALADVLTQAITLTRQWVAESVQAGDVARKTAMGLGLTTEAYQELVFAAEISGATTEQINVAFAQLAKRSSDAAKGSKEAAQVFKSLGVNVKDSSGQLKGQDQLLADVSDQFAGMQDGTEKTALAVRLFGESGAKLIPFLNAGSAGIAELRQEARDLGVVMSDDAAKDSEKYNDSMRKLGGILEGLRNKLVAGVLPHVQRVVDWFTKWSRKGDRLQIILENLERVLWAVVTATAAWLAVLIVGKLKAFGTALLGLIAKIKAFGTAGLIASVKVAAIGLAAVLALLALEDLISFIEGKDSVLGRILGEEKSDEVRLYLKATGAAIKAVVDFFVDSYNWMKQFASDTIDGIVTIWEWSVEKVAEGIATVVEFFEWLWDQVKAGAQAAWDKLGEGYDWLVIQSWKVINWIARGWDWFAGGVESAFDTVLDALVGVYDTIKSKTKEAIDGALKLWGKLADAIKEVLNIGQDEASGPDPELQAQREKQWERQKAQAELDLAQANAAQSQLNQQLNQAIPSRISTQFSGFSGLAPLAANKPQSSAVLNIGQVNVPISGTPDQTLTADDIKELVAQGLTESYQNEWANLTEGI